MIDAASVVRANPVVGYNYDTFAADPWERRPLQVE
jgi:hypothetical protein